MEMLVGGNEWNKGADGVMNVMGCYEKESG
jgi:hypothetical protein